MHICVYQKYFREYRNGKLKKNYTKNRWVIWMRESKFFTYTCLSILERSLIVTKFKKDIKIPEWFGDFGGYIATDTDFLKHKIFIEEIENLLPTEKFDRLFIRNLNLIVPEEWNIEKIDLVDGRTIYVAPDLSRHYNLAGQLAIAEMLKRKIVQAGTNSKTMAIAFAEASKKLGFYVEIVLSEKLSNDSQLVEKLVGLGCKVDTTTCSTLLDIPHAYFERAFFTPEESYVVTLEANFGKYPKPGLVGLLAEFYGKDLKSHFDKNPECCVVPITTGTEAIGVLKAFLGDDCKLATVEMPVAQEFHVVESGTYTLSTKGSFSKGENVSLCPELISWWRSGKVLRLGCDRLAPLNIDYLSKTNLDSTLSRAVALAFEKVGCSQVLVIRSENE